MERTRLFENKTKVDQVYYNRLGDPINLKPGQKYVEDLSTVPSMSDLLGKEMNLKRLEMDNDESKRVRKALTMARLAKTEEDIERLKQGETNQDVRMAILEREKEILNESGGAKK